MTQFEKAKRKNTPSRKKEGLVLSVVLFLGACLYGFSFLTANQSYITCFDTPYPAYEGVEHNAHFKFPLSAQNIEFDADSHYKCSIMVSFDMAPNELETFFASTLANELEPNVFAENIPPILRSKGWQKIPANILIGTGVSAMDGPSPFGQQVLYVDPSRSDRLSVTLVFMWIDRQSASVR